MTLPMSARSSAQWGHDVSLILNLMSRIGRRLTVVGSALVAIVRLIGSRSVGSSVVTGH